MRIVSARRGGDQPPPAQFWFEVGKCPARVCSAGETGEGSITGGTCRLPALDFARRLGRRLGPLRAEFEDESLRWSRDDEEPERRAVPRRRRVGRDQVQFNVGRRLRGLRSRPVERRVALVDGHEKRLSLDARRGMTMKSFSKVVPSLL